MAVEVPILGRRADLMGAPDDALVAVELKLRNRLGPCQVRDLTPRPNWETRKGSGPASNDTELEVAVR